MRNLENYKNNRFKSLIFSLILFLIITTGLVTVAEAETTAQFDFSDIYNADTVYGNDKSGAFDSWAALITGTVAENNGNPRDDGLPDDGVFPSTSTHPRIELAKFHTDDGFNAWQSSGTGSVTANVTNGQYKTVHLIASAGGAGTNNPAKFEVVLHYSDDTTDRSQEFTVPDWYGDISDPGYALKDNMDRWSNGGNLYENSDDPAIWGFAMQADSTKTLESITIDVTANEAGSFNFFGGAATTQETDVIEKPRISSFELTNPSDKNLAVNFDSDKQLSVISVSITGAESATFTGTNFTEADNGDGTYTYEATYNSNSDGDYTATLEIAEDAEGNDGASGEQDSVNIDTTPPQITGFKVSNPSGQNLLLNFTSNEDLAAISVSISGAESATFTGAYFTETDNADGTYTYETIYNGNSDGDYTATLETAEDAEGNDGASGEEDIVNIDTTPPVINAVEFPVNSNTGDIVGIGFNVNDNIGITSTDFNISTNNTAELTENGNWYNYTLNVPVDSVDDIVFNATFSDGADNFNASSDKTISVSDNIDPVIQDIVYEENVNTGDVVAIGFNVNDNIGITSTDFNISTNETAELTNDGNWYNYTLNVPVDSVNDIDFNATFSDAAGNFNSTDDISVNVSDNIDPVIQDIVYEENVNTGDIVGIGFNVNDNIGIASTDFNISTNETAELTEDGNWYNYTLNVPLDSVDDIVFNATFSDGADNFNINSDKTINVTDNIAPVIQDIVYEENANTGDIVGIGFNVNDNIGIASTDFNISTNETAELTEDGNWYNYTLNVPLDSVDDIVFNATFSDGADNYNTSSDKTINATDNIAPVIQDIVYEENVNTGDVVAIGFNVNDNIGITSTDFNISTNETAELTNDGNWYNYTLNVPVDSVNDIDFNATFSDAAGNFNSTDDISVNVSDNIDPVIQDIVYEENVNTGDIVGIGFNVNDNIGIASTDFNISTNETAELTEDGNWYNYTLNVPLDSVDDIVFNATFSDGADNYNTSSDKTINVTDNIAPVIQDIVYEENVNTGDVVAIGFNVNDNIGITSTDFNISTNETAELTNDGNWYNYTLNVPLDSVDDIVFNATFSDGADNYNTSSDKTINVTDNIAPVIQDIVYEENVNTGDVVAIGFNVNDNIGITSTDFNISTNETAELTNDGNWYNYTLNVPVDSVNDIDFNATFSDAAGNFNSTDDISVNVSDNIDPVIQDIVYEENVNTGDIVGIGFNVNDNIGIASTDFNISTNETAELTEDGNWYNYTLNVPLDSVDDIVFNATFSDTSGNYNTSSDKTINVTDNIAPVIQDIVYEENVNTGDVVAIGFNVNDNIGITSTDFNISTNETAELTNDGNWYNYTLNVPVDSVNDIDFNATFSDAAGNFNSTDDISVNVSDNIDPVIQDIVYEENANTGDIVGIGFNVNDNIGIASTDFNISTNETAELTEDGNWYNYTLNVPLDSVDDIVFNATFSDTSGNYNTSSDKTINVTDNIAPVIQDIVYEENVNTGDVVAIGFNVNDNIGIASTDFNISTNETAELTEDGNWYNYTLNVPLDSVDDIVFNATFSDGADNYNTSSDKTINVTDNIAPVIQDIVYEENVNTGDVVAIGFNVNDNIGITSTDFNISTNETAELTNDGNWYNYTLNVPVDSVNDIDFNATFSDAAGNFNSTDDISVNVSDNIDPVIQDIVYEENVNTGDIVGIGFNVNDNIGIASTDFNISTNGTAELTKDGNWYNYTLNVPVDSVNDIDFNATFSDAAGNFNSTDDISVNVSDNIDPVIQDIVYEENVNTGDIVGIGFNVNDNIGIASTDFNISTNGTAELTKDGNWYNYTLNVPLDSVDDIVFNATFSDTSGNYNTSNDKTINVTDNIAPVIQDIVYEENANTGDIVGIGFNVNDNIGITSTDFNISTNETAELTEDGNWYNYTLNVPLDSVDDIVFNATFSDTSGNYNTSSDKTINVTDNIAPVIQDIVYEENANTGDIVGIGFNVNDNIGITSTDFNISTNETAELTEDGNWYNYTLNVPVDSVNDIDFNATFSDAAGNFNSTDDISVNVSDNIDPVIQDIVYEENVNTGDIVGIGFNVNDNIGIASTDFNISTNGTAELTKDGNWYNYSLHVPVDSINDIDFNATFSDTAGNSNATDDKTISVTDNIAPVIQDIVYEEDVNTGDVVAIGFNVTDHIGITSTDFNISTNGTAELTKGGNWYNYTLTVPEDSVDDIVFNATFSDAAGNSNATDDITVNVSDNIKPSYNWFNKVESANTGDNITIKLNATDNIGVETYNITVDGDEYQMKEDSGNYTHNISIPASDSGTLVSSITYNCTFGDAAGNLNSTGNTVINVSVLPIANFSANVTRGTTPLSVEFSDNSSGLVKSWNWDFGDGNTSTEQNPSHVFGSGNFTVNLTVENNNGTSTKHLNIRAADEPVYVVSPNETELLSKYGEEMNFSINNTLFSSYEWFIDGTPLNGSGVTLHNNNTDDSAHLSYCNVNTSQYIDQDDFFMDVYNISAHVSNESLERTDVFSWEWTVTNSSAKQGDEIDHLINKTPEEVTKIGSESHVRFNTSNETSEKTGIECSINMVSFNTSNETDDIQIKIEVLNTSALNESEIDFSKGSVYQYMDISFNNESLVNEGSNNRSIEFKVYNEVNGGTLLINTVYLRHKDTSGWEAYKPELLRNDGTYSHFIVRDIPSFSPYAVTADYEYDSATKSDDGLPAYLKWKMFKEQMEGSTEGDEVVDVEKPESEDTVSSQQPDSTDIPEDTNKEDTTTADGDNNLAAMCIGLLGLIAILLIISKRKEK